MKAGNRSVLLIDDDFSEIINFQRYLIELNLNISLYTSSTYRDSFEILCGNAAKVKPDIVLINLDFAAMNGYEFLKLVRNYYSLRHIKIFLLTSGSLEMKNIPVDLDVLAVLRKPLNFNKMPGSEAVASYNLLINALM